MDPIARGLAAQALKGAALKSNKVAWFGDSRVGHGFNDSNVAGAPYVNRGFATWTRMYALQRFATDGSLNFGVSGDTTTLMVARLGAAVSACRAAGVGIVVILAGVNDALNSIASSVTIANVNTICTAFRAAGIYVILIPELPNGYTVNQLVQEYLHRQFLEFSAIPGVYVCDPWPDFADPITGIAKTNYTDGAVHQQPAGSRVIGLALAKVFNALLPPCPLLPGDNVDQWSATNPLGNLLVNPMLATGTGGTAGKLDGVNNAGVADNWAITSAAGVTVTPTLTTDSNGYPCQQIAYTGTPTGSGAQFIIMSQTTGATVNAGLATGDQIDQALAIEIQNLVGTLAVESQTNNNNGNLATDSLPGGTGTASFLPTIAANEVGILRSPVNVLGATHPSVIGIFQICVLAGTACSGTVKISRFGTRKL